MDTDISLLDKKKWLRSFGRTKGQRFKEKNLIRLNDYLFNGCNANNCTYHLEIGFGYGEHLLHKAQLNPHIQYIGAEVYLNGVGNLLQNITAHNIKNIYIWPDDVRILLEKFPELQISKTYILFPDPWPKRRTNKRRLINSEFLSLLFKRMNQDFEIIVASDIVDYIKWVEKILSNFNYPYTKQKPLCMNNIKTRYQSKSTHTIHWLSITQHS